MTVSNRTKIAALAAGAIATVAVTAGATYAATITAASTSKPTAATACVNAKHQLRIVSSSGKCPKGDTPLTVGVAPTAVSISGSLSPSHPLRQAAAVGAISVQAACTTDIGGTTAALYLTSSAAFVVQGNDYVNTTGGGFITPGGTQTTSGAGQITAAVAAHQRARFEADEPAGATGTFEIVQGKHTVSVTFATFAFGPSCSVQAQFTPSR